jgi:predicted nucleotidyltransferase
MRLAAFGEVAVEGLEGRVPAEGGRQGSGVEQAPQPAAAPGDMGSNPSILRDERREARSMKDLTTIVAELRQLQTELQARYPIRAIGVFGSYARGEQRPDSDLDLVIDLGPGLTLIDLARIETELAQRLGLPVELAIKDALKPRIEKRILAEAIMV